MRKFVAVVKHEYKKVVLKWTFLLGTFLFPLIGVGFAVVPALIFSIEGEPTRLVIVDRSGKIAARLVQNLSIEHIRGKARETAEKQMGKLNSSQQDVMK